MEWLSESEGVVAVAGVATIIGVKTGSVVLDPEDVDAIG